MSAGTSRKRDLVDGRRITILTERQEERSIDVCDSSSCVSLLDVQLSVSGAASLLSASARSLQHYPLDSLRSGTSFTPA